MPARGNETVVCSRCGERYAAPYELELWSCPLCKAGNDSTAPDESPVRVTAAPPRRKPLAMQLRHAVSPFLGKKPLYAYADRLISVSCPHCSATVDMTNNVRIARCGSCGVSVQRA